MSGAETPILEVEAVSKHFGRFVALNKVTASFQPRSATLRTLTIGKPPRSSRLSSFLVINWKVSG